MDLCPLYQSTEKPLKLTVFAEAAFQQSLVKQRSFCFRQLLSIGANWTKSPASQSGSTEPGPTRLTSLLVQTYSVWSVQTAGANVLVGLGRSELALMHTLVSFMTHCDTLTPHVGQLNNVTPQLYPRSNLSVKCW